jgi:transcriptional regulator with XRE-family HTH domain
VTVSQQLREFIAICGMTRYQIAKLTGIEQSVLSRFMAGSSLRSDNVDKIAAILGLELTRRKRGKDGKDGKHH